MITESKEYVMEVHQEDQDLVVYSTYLVEEAGENHQDQEKENQN